MRRNRNRNKMPYKYPRWWLIVPFITISMLFVLLAIVIGGSLVVIGDVLIFIGKKVGGINHNEFLKRACDAIYDWVYRD